MSIYYWVADTLRKTWFLITLIIVNFLGSIYGFYWYKEQLHATSPAWLRLFVPDSPTGSSLFTLFLILLWLGKRFPALEALAAVTNFKYGVWAVLVILSGWSLGNEQHWPDYMLLISHGGMAFESVLYGRFYTFHRSHLAVAAAWVIVNDIMDYTFGIYPWLPAVLEPYHVTVGLLTFLLSLFSLILFLMIRRYYAIRTP